MSLAKDGSSEYNRRVRESFEDTYKEEIIDRRSRKIMYGLIGGVGLLASSFIYYSLDEPAPGGNISTSLAGHIFNANFLKAITPGEFAIGGGSIFVSSLVYGALCYRAHQRDLAHYAAGHGAAIEHIGISQDEYLHMSETSAVERPLLFDQDSTPNDQVATSSDLKNSLESS